MGFLSVYSECVACRIPFLYNPIHVPSIRVDGVRQPICESCMGHVNAARQRRGLDPYAIHPNAYVGEDEANVPLDADD